MSKSKANQEYIDSLKVEKARLLDRVLSINHTIHQYEICGKIEAGIFDDLGALVLYTNTVFRATIKTERRDIYYAYARIIFMRYARQYFPTATLAYIGQSIDRNHATVIHGLKRYPVLYKENPMFRDMAKMMEKALSNEA